MKNKRVKDNKRKLHKQFFSNKWEKKWRKQNRIWKLFIAIYFVALIISSDNITAGYFLHTRLGITHTCTKVYKIAIIDSSFDLSQVPSARIVGQRNISNNSPIISKVPMFDYSGNVQFSNHGTDIMKLFIGEFGLLPNAMIVPIQINNSEDLAEATQYAISQGVDAISISLSFAPSFRAMPIVGRTALLEAAKHVPIVVAAGNDGQALESTTYGQSMLTLVNAAGGKIFLVAATKFSIFGLFGRYIDTKYERLTNFTNFSQADNQYVISAPGENIKLGNIAQQTLHLNSLHGTSIAAPLALIKAIYCVNNAPISQPITLIQALALL